MNNHLGDGVSKGIYEKWQAIVVIIFIRPTDRKLVKKKNVLC